MQFPVCGASRCSFLTGWPTSVRGHRSLYYFLRPEEPNLFRYLKDGGYDVIRLGKNDAFAANTFHSSVTEWKTGAVAPTGGGKPPVNLTPGITSMLLPPSGDRRSTNDYSLVQEAIRALERREGDRPVCIFLALFDPHPPYSAPTDFYDMYEPSSLPPLVPPGGSRRPIYHEAIRKAYGLDRLSESNLRRVRAETGTERRLRRPATTPTSRRCSSRSLPASTSPRRACRTSTRRRSRGRPRCAPGRTS